jgi:serine/threonine protein phosphatase PrpC
MKLVVGQHTDKGRIREVNEDDLLVDAEMSLYAVADGMGGHRAGEVASRTALETLRAAVASGKAIRDAISDANEAVMERAAGDEGLYGMGTTVTAGTLAAGGTFLVGHVGDSRAYIARDGELRQITEDHSLVEEMVRNGQLTPQQAEAHPQRSIITRALGMEPDVEIDLYPVELHEGDRLLLCSDGLTTMVRSEAIATILDQEDDPQRTADELVEAANAAGGEDNITVLVVDVVGDATVTPTPEAAPTAGVRAKRDEGRRVGRARRVARAVAWALPVLAVLGLAFGVTAWYARRTYYVGFDARDRVTLSQGRPGGVLFWDPTVERRTKLVADDLSGKDRADIRDKKTFSSRDDAERYLARLERDAQRRATTSSTTTTSPPPPPVS